MKVVVNGEPCEIQEAATVRALLEHLGLTTGLVAVEVNKARAVAAPACIPLSVSRSAS